ncbi:MAG TPA: cation diffusion facilitator family transporter [Bacillus sp. (in: firmicutes)]|uniref:cation diffusion facilitator family transporter n=1 Tax=Bacillus litorisediminis TaxID=2922713 RepID=UPI001FAB9E88|nr:cation diffusion facilitator family transporter [Bacillus litorisediminis]HWO78297.1 cation diffusion facilitator family transporter [Bacillus sp. (in: firmicutes)]
MGHSHHHGHSHDHHHHHHSHSANKKVLLISFILIFAFMIVEVIGGFLTNSLALLSDAGHMLSDAAALGLSLIAFKIGERAANDQKTYGYKRFEILAAFINGITLVVISLYIVWEAYHRFFEPPEVSTGMILIAVIGLIVNLIVAWILMRGDTSGNLNLRSALLHVVGDMLGSFGAILAGLLIFFFNWNIADPIASVLVAILVLVSGWRVTKDSFHVLMEGTPAHIDCQKVKTALLKIPGVKEVHDLHVWTITSDFLALSCHLVVNEAEDRDTILKNTTDLLKSQFHLKHTTIQLEGEQFEHRDEHEFCR